MTLTLEIDLGRVSRWIGMPNI